MPPSADKMNGDPPSNDKMPHLLTLPGEIKNKIWGYCVNNEVKLVHQAGTSVHTPQINGAATWVPNDEVISPNSNLGLLLTCKSVYCEVKNLPSSTTEVFCRSPSYSDRCTGWSWDRATLALTKRIEEVASNLLEVKKSVERDYENHSRELELISRILKSYQRHNPV